MSTNKRTTPPTEEEITDNLRDAQVGDIFDGLSLATASLYQKVAEANGMAIEVDQDHAPGKYFVRVRLNVQL